MLQKHLEALLDPLNLQIPRQHLRLSLPKIVPFLGSPQVKQLLSLLILLGALLGTQLVFYVEFQLGEVDDLVNIIITLYHFDILVHMIRIPHYLQRVLAHMGRYVVRPDIEFLLGGLAQHIPVLIDAGPLLQGTLA